MAWIDDALANVSANNPELAGQAQQFAKTGVQPQMAVRGEPAPGVAAPDQTGQAPAPQPQMQQQAPTQPQQSQQGGGGNSWDGKSGFELANDPNYVRQQATQALTQRAQAYGRPAPSQADIDQAVNYVLTPDTYSDNQVRSGWSDYWGNRFGVPGNEGAASGDKGGDATLVRGATPQLGGGGGARGGAAGAGAGGGTLQSYGQQFNPGTAFKPPSADDVMNSPAVQARLRAGEQGLQRSAAARGTLLTGGTLKDLANYDQDVASQEYGNEYARQFGANQDAFGRGVTGQQFNRDTTWGDADRQFSRLADFTQLGQSGAAQLGGYSGGYGNATANAGNNYTNNLGQAGQGYTGTLGQAGSSYGAATGANAANQGNLAVGQGATNGNATIAGTNATNAAGSTIANALGQVDWSKVFTKKPASPTAAPQGDATRPQGAYA